MKDWFYASGSEIVFSNGSVPKSKVAIAIRDGNNSIEALESLFVTKALPEEREDVDYLIRVYSPMAYENRSGCSGCDGCCAKTDDS